MFIDKSMTRKVITIRPEAGIIEAREKMDKHNIRHLPVVDEDNNVLGIISDRDIRSALPSVFSASLEEPAERERILGLTVGDVMTEDMITFTPHDTLTDALLMMHKTKKGAFPIVDWDGKLKGIISIRDLIRAFINVMGLDQPGTLLCLVAEDKVGQMKRIVDAITEEGISIGSILTARHWDEGKRAVFPYLLTVNVTRVKRKLQDMGYTLLDPMEWSLEGLPVI